MTRILHFADLHLDRSFAGLGMASSEATKRREELRAALRRIVDLALELNVDAVTVGGDLYEHDRVTSDTGNFIGDQFSRLAPRPVLIAPGNHDPYVPDGLYWRLRWPDNVRIFDSMSWQPVQLAGSVTVWGVGHRGPAIRDNLLRDLRVDGAQTNVALFHGSDVTSVPEGKSAHCPFEREDVARSGAAFALLGHYHDMRLWPADSPRYGYPGSPEPLDFSEEGPHHVLLLTAGEGGVAVAPLQINEVTYQTKVIDVGGISSSDGVREAIRNLAGEDGPSPLVTRVVLSGQSEVELDLDKDALLRASADYFRYLDIVNRTEPAFDFEQIREESTTRGAFVRMLQKRLADANEAERGVLEDALRYGLQAFAGQGIRRR